MSSFISKKIQSIQTLGEKLIEHRKKAGFSREKAAKILNLNVKYLKFLEENNYKEMPADIYTVNILKMYANLLKLNPAMVVDCFNKEKSLYQKIKFKKQKNKKTKFQKLTLFFLNPKFIKYLALFIIIASILSYIGYEVHKITVPPQLTITSPTDNLSTTESQITIQGKTEKEVQLEINNRPFLSDDQGNFSITLDLAKGLNIIKISAQKKHSQQNIIFKKVILQ